jgi:hypothetical protein
LIPEYDEVLTGWAEIGIPRAIADRRRGKPTSTFDRPVLYGGEWIGTWRRTIGPNEVAIELERFGKWTQVMGKSMAVEGRRFERFLGKRVEIT